MSNIEVLNYIEDWLERRRLKNYFKSKEKRNTRYVKIKEEDFYEICYKLIDLAKDNIE